MLQLLYFPCEIYCYENFIGMVYLNCLLYKFIVLYLTKKVLDCFRIFQIGLKCGRHWLASWSWHICRQLRFKFQSQHEFKMTMMSQRQSGSCLIWRARANKTQREGWLTCSLEDGEPDDKNHKRGAVHQ